jgi:putative nucleotidyltransferase with HDIG domain
MGRARAIMLACEATGGLVALAVAASLSSSDQWDSPWLIALLFAMAVLSDAFGIDSGRGLAISGAFLAIVLAIALVGPTVAVLIASGSALVDGIRTRKPLSSQVTNVATYAIFPLAGYAVLEWVSGAFDAEIGSAGYAVALSAAFATSLVVNFLLIAAHQRVFLGRPMRDQVRILLIPFLPSELLTMLIAATVVSLYPKLGFAVVALVALVLLGFQYVLRELQRSQQRAERLRAIQVDVLFSMVTSLSLRDRMTARHSAAVARYAQAIARAAGATPHQQRLVHTAGLLHDIGKSIFPDHVLFADGGLDDEQWQIVKQHPAHGADMIAQIEEFAEVAAIVRAHHERIDGKGYPHGLAGEEVPWLARMISIADTYDVMTARDSYRQPVSPELAVAELRRVSGTQLDGELVDTFVAVLAHEGIAFAHGDDADFELELEEERQRARESGVHALKIAASA